MVAMTLASHLRVYGRILSSTAVELPETSWNDALAECMRRSPLAKHMSARSEVRSQQRLSLPTAEHGPDAPPRLAVAATGSAPPSSLCTKERKDTGATNSVPTQRKESRSLAKKRRRLSALDCTGLPFLPPPPPP
uniref:Uncharacterized protein n=1 Tax=Arundo donax TaxID=35708 RepID=A0A0A9DHS0_ARUDO